MMLKWLRQNLGYATTVENKVETMRATIVSDANGYTLMNALGNPVHTYSRRRDALRGAQRRGLQLA